MGTIHLCRYWFHMNLIMLLTYAWIESQDTTFLLIFELTKFSNFCVLGNRFLLKKNNYVLSSLWIVMVQEPFLWPHWNYATQYQKTSESEYYGTYFLFARLNLLHWYVYQRKIFDSDFPSPCFDVPKASNFTSGGVQKQETGNDCDVISGLQALQKTDFAVIFLLWANQFAKKWYNGALLIRKWEKVGEAWSPEMTAQSFPVSCFWSCSFVPHWQWNLTLLVHQNTGKENRYRKFFFLYLPEHWGFDRANKK